MNNKEILAMFGGQVAAAAESAKYLGEFMGAVTRVFTFDGSRNPGCKKQLVRQGDESLEAEELILELTRGTDKKGKPITNDDGVIEIGSTFIKPEEFNELDAEFGDIILVKGKITKAGEVFDSKTLGGKAKDVTVRDVKLEIVYKAKSGIKYPKFAKANKFAAFGA